MRKRKLVTKPMMRAALTAAADSKHEYLAGQVEDAVEAAATMIAEKVLNDFADYFTETGAVVGIDPKVTKSVANIARRYAKLYLS